MLVIDDSNLKLLKMKEKMLELSVDNAKTLEEYREIALAVDNECYQMIINKIKENNYNNLPLEEQISFLDEVLEDYNYLNELQCNFRNVYGKYSSDELVLSDLGSILIDNVQARVGQIQGYLMNVKNLETNKKELDRLNQLLVDATKEEGEIEEVTLNIRKRLQDDVMNAKGRIYGDEGALEVTSIALELKEFDIDLEAMIKDESVLYKNYFAAKREKKDIEETLNIALSLPNRDDTICSTYMFEVLKKNYKFNMVELIKEIYGNNNEYYSFKETLRNIANLIREIKNGLREMGVKFYINPFDYIKIKDYIETFSVFKDHSEEIARLREEMTNLTRMIEDTGRTNNEFSLSMMDEIEILNLPAEAIYIDIDDKQEDSKQSIYELLEDDHTKDNQVVRVTQIKDDFMMERVRQKTRGVINRVNEMIHPSQAIEVGTAPLLVIEAKKEPIAVEEPKKAEEHLFEEVEPFLEPSLFDDKIDEGVFENNQPDAIFDDKKEPVKIESEPAMPEAFWVSKDEVSSVLDEPQEVLIKRR